MSITITLGWWMLPLAVSLIALGKTLHYAANRKITGDYDFGVDVLLIAAVSLIVSLGAWTIYLGIKLALT